MYVLPLTLHQRFTAYLGKKGVQDRRQGEYQKWLRFYLDFCFKYHMVAENQESLPAFVKKLQDKKQSLIQREQAVEAITAFYELGNADIPGTVEETAIQARPLRNESSANIIEKEDTGPGKPVVQGKKSPVAAATLSNDLGQSPDKEGGIAPPVTSESLARIPKKPTNIPSPAKTPEHGASWQQEYSQLINEIHLRHYSPKTLKSYQSNVRTFQAFTRSKPPESLTTDDVKEFLTFLAVKKQVAASTQNLAFNSLLFFYRHILHKEFGKVDGGAKKRPHIPVVLSREEIDMVLQHLEPPYDLIVKLLYGCGLRLFECMGLRVQCLNFDAGIVTVHDGKGQKDRTVPMPQSIMPELQIQLATLKELHREDQRKEYAGVFLVNALEKKYKNAAREFIWQWLFPAKQLTRENGTGELRRYHLYVTHVQKAIKRAADDAGVCKRVTAHTFRHSFASHLLQKNFDIRTIQELLGHSDVRTTMIYTHTVKSVTLKEVKSPLDF